MCREVGQVATGHHKVALTMRSILDTDMDEVPEAEPMPDNFNLPVATPKVHDSLCGADGDDACNLADTHADMDSPGEDAVPRKPYKASPEDAAPSKEDEESPLQVADTPMTDSPHLEEAPKLQCATSPGLNQEIDVPDMNRLKIGNKAVSASLAALREGDEVPCAHHPQDVPPAQEKRVVRPGTLLLFLCHLARYLMGLLVNFRRILLHWTLVQITSEP